jgi:GAF domain-containing protein
MSKPPVPENEEARLSSLRDYNILDTPPEEAFDIIAHLASNICGTPIGLVTLMDRHRQWFKSRVGLDVPETPRDLAFCAYTILQPTLFVIPDTRTDERFMAHPLVANDPKIRFYAGAPLITGEGYALGTLCVIDHIPRELTVDQKSALLSLAYLVVIHLDNRRRLAVIDYERQQLGIRDAA